MLPWNASIRRPKGGIPGDAALSLLLVQQRRQHRAISQLCELTWQLRGQAGERQVANAKVGVAVNQGLFGHGSAVLATI